MIQTDELLEFFQERYRRARGTRRDIRSDDRLYDDLGIDSLLANELLIALEDRFDIPLLHDPRVWKVARVDELLEIVCQIEAGRSAATSTRQRSAA